MLTRSVNGFTSRPRRFDNYRWIPWAFVGVFVVIIAVNAGLVYFALSSWPGLTVQHAYEDGLTYNRVIAETEKEARLGWKFTIKFVSDGAGTASGRLIVDAADKDGRALENLVLKLELERPVDALPPVQAQIAHENGGRYTAHLALPRAGQWEAYLAAARDKAVYHTGTRFVAP